MKNINIDKLKNMIHKVTFDSNKLYSDFRVIDSNDSYFICEEQNNICKLMGTCKSLAPTFRKHTNIIESLIYAKY